MKTKVCKTCGGKTPRYCLVGKYCYICILKKWPPKTIRQYKKYSKAVAISMSLESPLNLTEASEIVEEIGLDNLETLNEIKIGYLLSHITENTFYERVKDKLNIC